MERERDQEKTAGDGAKTKPRYSVCVLWYVTIKGLIHLSMTAQLTFVFSDT